MALPYAANASPRQCWTDGCLYRLLRATFEPHLPVGMSCLRKTAELVQEMTHTGSILDPRDVYVLDEGVLDMLTETDKPDTVKVFNLVKVLEQQACEKGAQQPYLIPIGERAEQIAEAFQQRLIDAQRALEELTVLLQEARSAEQDRQESGMTMSPSPWRGCSTARTSTGRWTSARRWRPRSLSTRTGGSVTSRGGGA